MNVRKAIEGRDRLRYEEPKFSDTHVACEHCPYAFLCLILFSRISSRPPTPNHDFYLQFPQRTHPSFAHPLP